MIKKGTYVTVRQVVLQADQRSSNLPDDTKKVPLVMWVKGKLLNDCQPEQEAEVLTRTGRRQKGIICEIEPRFTHDYGKFVPELYAIDEQLNKEREEFEDE